MLVKRTVPRYPVAGLPKASLAVTVTLSAGQTVYVVVDGYDSAEFGTYILNVQ